MISSCVVSVVFKNNGERELVEVNISVWLGVADEGFVAEQSKSIKKKKNRK